MLVHAGTLHKESHTPDSSEAYWIAAYEWRKSFDFHGHMCDILELFLKPWELIYHQRLISQEKSVWKESH